MAKKIYQEEFVMVTPELLKERFSNLSKEDIDFILPTEKLLSRTGNEIGRKKYNHLKETQSFYNNYNFLNPKLEPKILTDLELKQIATFESEMNIVSEDFDKKNKEYMQFVRDGKKRDIETTKGIIPDVSNLYHGFMKAFEVLHQKKFELTEDSILNLKAVVMYFARDQKFFKCERLVTKIDERKLVPSFYKGILIVGDFGNGKTAILQTFQYLIEHNYRVAFDKKWDNISQWNDLRFNIKACRSIASEYEFLGKDDSKKAFIDKYSSYNYCFDDITKEQIASNYGLKNVIQIVLENRYDDIFVKIRNEKRINYTHGTLNYHKGSPNNVKIALQSIGLKYEPHMYDRVLELFNIIEFKGKSFRK